MTEMTNETPDTEIPVITDAEIGSFIEGGKLPSYHTILEVWREVLRPAKDEKDSKVTPAWANRVVASYQDLCFQDMVDYRDAYFAKIIQLADILDYVISQDGDALSYATPAEDREHNSVHYKNLLLLWQQAVLQWELDWDCTDLNAGVEVAAISEVHKMFFGETGLTAHLDNIQFEFTEDDQAVLAEALEQLKDGQ